MEFGVRAAIVMWILISGSTTCNVNALVSPRHYLAQQLGIVNSWETVFSGERWNTITPFYNEFDGVFCTVQTPQAIRCYSRRVGERGFITINTPEPVVSISGGNLRLAVVWRNGSMSVYQNITRTRVHYLVSSTFSFREVALDPYSGNFFCASDNRTNTLVHCGPLPLSSRTQFRVTDTVRDVTPRFSYSKGYLLWDGGAIRNSRTNRYIGIYIMTSRSTRRLHVEVPDRITGPTRIRNDGVARICIIHIAMGQPSCSTAPVNPTSTQPTRFTALTSSTNLVDINLLLAGVAGVNNITNSLLRSPSYRNVRQSLIAN